jgi:hypothetical protein
VLHLGIDFLQVGMIGSIDELKKEVKGQKIRKTFEIIGANKKFYCGYRKV